MTKQLEWPTDPGITWTQYGAQRELIGYYDPSAPVTPSRKNGRDYVTVQLMGKHQGQSLRLSLKAYIKLLK